MNARTKAVPPTNGGTAAAGNEIFFPTELRERARVAWAARGIEAIAEVLQRDADADGCAGEDARVLSAYLRGGLLDGVRVLAQIVVSGTSEAAGELREAEECARAGIQRDKHAMVEAWLAQQGAGQEVRR